LADYISDTQKDKIAKNSKKAHWRAAITWTIATAAVVVIELKCTILLCLAHTSIGKAINLRVGKLRENRPRRKTEASVVADGWSALRIERYASAVLECPVIFEPVLMRETESQGAGHGTKEEAHT
jgi:hypothetical protein